MTVLEKVSQDIRSGAQRLIAAGEPLPCVICGDVSERRYGCCFACSQTTPFDDPRVLHDDRNDAITC
jgi:hypothetical protein